jgi:hypothetical protein
MESEMAVKMEMERPACPFDFGRLVDIVAAELECKESLGILV